MNTPNISFSKLKRPNIIVCGDIMLDHATHVQIEKIANEAPIPVYNFKEEYYTLGGCGNVLQNLYNLGCENLFIMSVVGNDVQGERIHSLVNSMKIHNYIQTYDGFHTTTKERFFCDNKIIYRFDRENTKQEQKVIGSILFEDILEKILQTTHIDCILLSDYNKGVLTFEQCQRIIQLANKYNVFTCVDPKENPDKYRGCTLIKPNLSEACKLFGLEKSTPILEIHKVIQARLECQYSVVTMSEKGITLYNGKDLLHEIPNVHKIIDVTGAGDIVCCLMGYFIPMQIPISEVVYLATHIATKSVEYPGSYTVSMNDVYELNLKHTTIITRDDISVLKHVFDKQTIVFTNGCFDILHSGHIQLFKFCKSQGNIVVLGLNSDASIRRLKGDTRPINPLSIRLDILSSIQYIDYIIVFEEDTPYEVLQLLKPDILVKGGDYNVNAIVGREFAKETILCNFVPDNSTTGIIQKIQKIGDLKT